MIPPTTTTTVLVVTVAMAVATPVAEVAMVTMVLVMAAMATTAAVMPTSPTRTTHRSLPSMSPLLVGLTDSMSCGNIATIISSELCSTPAGMGERRPSLSLNPSLSGGAICCISSTRRVALVSPSPSCFASQPGVSRLAGRIDRIIRTIATVVMT
jgi:hypothetical protein